MDIKSAISENLGIIRLTGLSLREAIAGHYARLSDHEKRRINRAIAHVVLQTLKAKKDICGSVYTGKADLLPDTKVLAVNYAGLLDVTVDWKTGPDGSLEPAGYHIDAGGDSINVAKVFSHFDENIALVALTGKKESE
ncbi:MAG: hypothetical protein PHS37_09365, partial [Candidatus Omnitrophica bacterium]|nr:hypothetical protein [Candidatus Omnitrophota bacterium]